jgi:hypothetical protein
MADAKIPVPPERYSSMTECGPDAAAVTVRLGHPRVRPHVVPVAGKTTPQSKDDLVTSFIVVWQPSPPPPPLWVRFLQEAPFGSQLVRARDLRWDGKFLSIELLKEEDIEAFAAEIPSWVEYANARLASCERSPAALAQKEAQRRALELENRLRGDRKRTAPSA